MSPANFLNLIGKTFGRLQVINRAPSGKNWRTCWHCKCICGNTLVVSTRCLKSGNTKSCGCLNKELAAQRALTHGMSKTSEYRSWCHMKGRCYNPTDTFYKNYGACGITICPEWINDFMAFYEHIGSKPNKTDSIDRIDNDGDYRPGNVRWTNAKTQNNNKRNNHLITIQGVTKNIAQWANIMGISRHIITNRLRQNWNPQKAVLTPKIKNDKRITVNRVTRTAIEWAKITGISATNICKRIRRGWSPAKALSQPLKPL